LVLALAALVVWWNVFDTEGELEAQEAQACASASAAPPSLDPTTVSLRVFNATDKGGLAQEVAATLQERGFIVEEIANDPTEREVTGVGELRHGPRGNEAATYVALFLPGAGDFPDTRATATVDFVIGPDFAGLASPEDVDAALGAAASATAAC
jgi:LytR cell envelope-related transcriptional attenuator